MKFRQVLERNEFNKNRVLFFALVVTLRFFNIYGDMRPFVVSGNFYDCVKSFLNLTKYPPSLLYFLATIPFGLLMMAAVKRESLLVNIISMYGKAPLFYYILHLSLLPAAAWLIAIFSGKSYETDNIAVIWLFTFLVIAFSYPLVVWFISFRKKYSHKIALLSYV